MSIKSLFLGRAKSLDDKDLFHKLSLIAVFAWVGLGADGLSSSCYGPEETYRALSAHPSLALLVALASVITIATLCASYSQIIALFPGGGGGYLVASKLLSPTAGVVSGSALLVDYVLTVALSVASGADALFSLLPTAWLAWKLTFAVGGVVLLVLVNLRGVRESVLLWVPVFAVFICTHAVVILWSLYSRRAALPQIAPDLAGDTHAVVAQVGWIGLAGLLLKGYSLGAGTYTGIEAVSNGLPILREPRVRTGRRTMLYMGVSLGITVAGLLMAYLLFRVEPAEGKTLNAVLLGHLTASWGGAGEVFSWITLASEAALLLIAAQAGFIDGPRVLANMAVDRWFPTRFATLSDRFVTQNGVLLIGGAAVAILLFAGGSVGYLVVLYSINVFVTFSLSQLGMVKHWWQERAREPFWRRRLAVNGFGLTLTLFILCSLCWVKFFEGGWITIIITGTVVAAAFLIHRHYDDVRGRLRRLDLIVEAVGAVPAADPAPPINAEERTAVVLVNGYNGLGLHTLLHVPRMFGDSFRNYVFLSVGTVDAGNFKGAEEIAALRTHIEAETSRYVAWAQAHGYGAKAYASVGHDIVDEIMTLARRVATEFPHRVFFAGQLAFREETRLTRFLHNYSVFVLHRRFFLASLPFVILPIRVDD